jgi:probable HAF family extracellular repeat protein
MKTTKLNLVIAISLFLLTLSAKATTSYNFTLLPERSTSSYTEAINNSGQVAGYAFNVNYSFTDRAALWNTINNTVDLLNPLDVTGSSYAKGINNSGQVVGFTLAGNNVSRATLWNTTNNSTTELSQFPSSANDINNSALVVGSSTVNDVSRATLWNTTNNSVTTLGTLDGSLESYADAINDSGQVVGTSLLEYSNRATLWNTTNNSTTELGLLDGTSSSYANDINNFGQVVGYSRDSSQGINYATLWYGDTVTDLGSLGGSDSYASAINNSGLVVGTSSNNDGYQRAFLWNGTNIVDLNSFLDASASSAGWVLQTASGINDNGWIVGSAINTKSFISSNYLLSVTPVPEPETYAMLFAGLGLMGFVTRRQKKKEA